MGCKVNTYDTSLLEDKLIKAGFSLISQDAQVTIINSCAVTEKSSLETHRFVKKIKSKNPKTLVVVTGCVAQTDVDRLTSLTGADLIVGNSHKGQIDEIIKGHLDQTLNQRVYHSNIFEKMELDAGGGIESSRTRAFLKIQDGCNSFCSFCIIPFARGKSRSLNQTHLVDRINDLHHKGFQEVVLTGVHCGDYENEGNNFSSLVEHILENTKIPRIRLSSLEPIEVTPKLWSLFGKQKRLCPHIHLSLQSANSKVLSDMKRKYSQRDVALFFNNFEKHIPHGFLGMDVIVGFPGETEGEFDDTHNFLRNHNQWTRIHVFPYSKRPGTLAIKRLDHLSPNVISARAKKLRELSLQRQFEKAKSQLGLFKSALVLEKLSYGAQSLSSDYWPIKIEDLSQKNFINQEVRVEITGYLPLKNGEQILQGTIAKNPQM